MRSATRNFIVLFGLFAGHVLAADADHAEVRIRLERGIGCMGCPAYSVEIRGDGLVRYSGKSSVLAREELSWTIPRADVDALTDAFRRAHYFELASQYGEAYFDGTDDESTLTLGGRSKSVADRGGKTCGDVITPGCVPAVLTKLHDSIDRVSRAASLVAIDDRSLELLERAGFDFRSRAAASALLFSLNEMDTRFARELIERGAPLDGGEFDAAFGNTISVPAIVGVPDTGDLDLARSMIARGALASPETRAAFLASSAASGGAGMTRVALDAYGDLRRNPAPFPLVMLAAQASMNLDGAGFRERYARPEYAAWVRDFDPPAVLRALIAAGADPKATGEQRNTALHVVASAESARVLIDAGVDPNAVNAHGRTPLHEARREPIVRELLRAGARANAEDADGKTPLFDSYDAQAVESLVAAGADVNHRAHDGSTPLFDQGNEDSTAALLRADADPKVRAIDGASALESVKSIGSAVLLLKAGAPLPEAASARQRLLEWAALNEATELQRLLQERLAPAARH